MDTILAKAETLFEEIVEIRREIHRHPELGQEETRTSALIKEQLVKYGADEILAPGGTSVIGVVKGRRGAGSCIGIRCDMDALPVLESTGLPFSSENNGVMHACGHDLHTAMMLGNAKILCDMRDEFAGTVKLIFEASEEKQPGGARAIIDSGTVDDVDVFLAMHVLPSEDALGKIGFKKGSVTTSADEVYITIYGKSGHGSQPQEAKDAILAASQINILLQQIQARNVNPLDTCIFSINSFHGGVATNIIAGECKMAGAMRAYTEETRRIATEKIYDICAGVEKVSGCTIDAKVIKGYDACINDDKIVDLLTAAFEETLGPESYYIMKEPLGFSEDYSFFGTITEKPSVLMFLNAGHALGMEVSTLHSPDCTFDEDAMKNGVAAMTHSVLALLKK